VLLGWLAFHRNALAVKCSGLDADQLVARSASPSALSPTSGSASTSGRV
jgi:hypothetical protein